MKDIKEIINEEIVKEDKKNITLPAIAMRGLVTFPKMIMHFDVSRVMSVKAIEMALKADRKIFIVTQKDAHLENPQEKDLYKIGVIAEVRQTLKTPDNVLRVLIEGVQRAKINSIVNDSDYLIADVKEIPNYSKSKVENIELEAMVRTIKDEFELYCSYIPQMPKELVSSVLMQDNPYLVFDNITFNISLDYQSKQRLLEESNILVRLSILLEALVQEVQILEVEREIQEQVKNNVDRNQKEYYLKEQIKAISAQLGEEENSREETFEYFDKIYDLNLSEESTEKLIKEAERLSKMPPSSQESAIIRNYLDNVIELPWNKSTKSKINIPKAQAVLDKDHYGLKKIKERILESIAVHALVQEVTGQIICLVGPPGVGKTSIGKSIAKALGRKYVRISLGGVRDESDIRGHRKTYLGSMPGRIIAALKQAGSNNPVILLDEIDKMSNDYKGDPSSAMLEVLDSEQNKEFRDHYIEIPFDLSKALFITTANTTQTIPAPLLDRMEIIELTSYTREEKFNIAKNYLVPKQIKKHGLKASQMKVSDNAVYTLIDAYTKEAGVRTLERTVASLCRKTVKIVVEGSAKKVSFDENNVSEYLGHKKYLKDEMSSKDEVGIVNGLAWTSVGGVIMPLEVMVLNGKGSVEITGSLGDVMKESAKLAVSYSRSVAKKYDIDEEFYKQKDIHIHAPEGAVPKDGPSAGVTMVTSMISALSGIPARSDVAMTGEITLHGKVLPIGGLREKTMAAYKAGIKTVIIPKQNKPDLEEVDEIVKNGINFIYAETLDEVLDNALVKIENKSEDFGIIMPNEIDPNQITIHS